MNIRKAIEEEFDESAGRYPAAWAEEIRNRNRVIDWWLLLYVRTALRTVNLSRYRNNAAVKRAVLEAREAVDKASNLVLRDYRNRVDN